MDEIHHSEDDHRAPPRPLRVAALALSSAAVVGLMIGMNTGTAAARRRRPRRPRRALGGLRRPDRAGDAERWSP